MSATTRDKSSFLIIAAPNILLPLATPCSVKGKISFEYKDLDQLNRLIEVIKINY